MQSGNNEYADVLNRVNTHSNPSQLRITDIKLAKLNMPPWGCYLIKIETNQGLTGFGEVRDGASPTYIKLLKSRLVGENPCEVDRLFRKIKQFGGHSRQAGGVCAVELALWDLAGKAYGAPVYQLLGGRFRDKVRLYADTHIESGRFTGDLLDPREVGKTLKGYMDQGFGVMKILSVELLLAGEGNFSEPLGQIEEVQAFEAEARRLRDAGDKAGFNRAIQRVYNFNGTPHPFTNMHITELGLDRLEQYIEVIRDVIGYKVSLAIDHFGHFPLVDAIKIARRLERFNLAWLEDLLPWYLTGQYKRLAESTTAPIATGEDIYLAENFEPLLANGSLSMVHPDLLTSGGILETKKLSDMAMRYGASMSMHMCESPIACIAGAHMATACENFFALEYDSLDSPWWADVVNGPTKPLAKDGCITVSDAPGLGIESLNDEVIREHGDTSAKDIWISTDEWDDELSLDRQWS
ncbi:MAG: mandelate racemase/muconate lactonizing enzyme family protein [Acetanaerobacterium sp.]